MEDREMGLNLQITMQALTTFPNNHDVGLFNVYKVLWIHFISLGTNFRGFRGKHNSRI